MCALRLSHLFALFYARYIMNHILFLRGSLRRDVFQPDRVIDLFPLSIAVDEQDIERAVLKDVGSLISKIDPLPKKLCLLRRFWY